jgi:hypothetical protein
VAPKVLSKPVVVVVVVLPKVRELRQRSRKVNSRQIKASRVKIWRAPLIAAIFKIIAVQSLECFGFVRIYFLTAEIALVRAHTAGDLPAVRANQFGLDARCFVYTSKAEKPGIDYSLSGSSARAEFLILIE